MEITDYLTLGTSPQCMTVKELQQAQELLTRASGGACRHVDDPSLQAITERLSAIEAELRDRKEVLLWL